MDHENQGMSIYLTDGQPFRPIINVLPKPLCLYKPIKLVKIISVHSNHFLSQWSPLWAKFFAVPQTIIVYLIIFVIL